MLALSENRTRDIGMQSELFTTALWLSTTPGWIEGVIDLELDKNIIIITNPYFKFFYFNTKQTLQPEEIIPTLSDILQISKIKYRGKYKYYK